MTPMANDLNGKVTVKVTEHYEFNARVSVLRRNLNSDRPCDWFDSQVPERPISDKMRLNPLLADIFEWMVAVALVQK
jgi:hypothetical protein